MGVSFKDSIISECVNVLKRKDVKDEINFRIDKFSVNFRNIHIIVA